VLHLCKCDCPPNIFQLIYVGMCPSNIPTTCYPPMMSTATEHCVACPVCKIKPMAALLQHAKKAALPSQTKAIHDFHTAEVLSVLLNITPLCPPPKMWNLHAPLPYHQHHLLLTPAKGCTLKTLMKTLMENLAMTSVKMHVLIPSLESSANQLLLNQNWLTLMVF